MSFDFDELPVDDAAVIKKHSRSFSLAARLLPAGVRTDVEKLYAWCRWCDDAVDEASDVDAARKRLELLRADVHRIYAGENPQHPASNWLGDVALRYRIPIELPLDLLSGMETDTGNPVMASVDDLILYCYQAAGTVGLMMCHIMGVTNPAALTKAKSLGMAMQLTNIARDVDEDWRSGRRYLPRDWLSLVPGKDLKPTNVQVRSAVKELLNLADELYVQGHEGLALLPNDVRFAIRLAGSVYREIGNEIFRRDFAVMNGRAFVSRRQKMFLFGKCFADELTFRFRQIIRLIEKPITQFKFFTNLYLQENNLMKNETRYLFYLGISLTLVMAATLFVLVGLNPKETSYESLPWIYSIVCAFLAAVTGLLARRYNGLFELESVKINSK